MTKIRKSLHTELGHSTPDRITVRGRDLPSETLGHFNLGDMAFLELTGRRPTPQESLVFNAILVTLVEHGITPSALVARLTYTGAPESGFRERKQIVPGLGHPMHKPIDPRTPRLFQLAEENGLSGYYVALMQAVQIEAERVSGKSLPINATGAIGAIACEFGFPWRIVRGFGVMARAVGLVGHILEEIDDPMGMEIWQRVEREAGAPRQD